MYKEDRRKEIIEILKDNREASVAELAEKFNVSSMTIRRDLLVLDEKGLIERTHGGATVSHQVFKVFEPAMVERVNTQLSEKRIIAKYAVEMINPREKIYLSSGTTTYWIAKELRTFNHELTVITNSMVIASELAAAPSHLVIIVIGGFLRRSEFSMVGHYTEAAIKDIHPDKVFMGIRGIDPEHGLTSDNLQELMTDRAILNSSDNVIVVADHTKFGSVAASLTAPVTAAKMVISTKKAPIDIVNTIRQQGVEVLLI